MPRPKQDAISTAQEDAPPRADPRASPLFVGSTEKAFQVLHAFDGPLRQMPLSAVAKAAKLDRSATQRLVHTLETLGYLKRVEGTRDYALTSKLLQFGYNYLRGSEIVARAAPYLLDISRHVGETVNLFELSDTDVVYLARFPGQHIVNVDIMVGTRLPALFTAAGTAMVARFPPAEAEAFLARSELKQLTPHSLIDKAAQQARLKLTADKGYAVIVNETVLGDISIAAAITDERGAAVAGVSIAVPTTRWTVQRAEAELATHVQVAAASISAAKAAGYR